MRILIKENNRTKLSLWLPSGPLVVSTFLRHFELDGKKFTPAQRKLIIRHFKRLRKIHKPLVLIDVEEKNGNRVLIKI
jgi:hypothetical protein